MIKSKICKTYSEKIKVFQELKRQKLSNKNLSIIDIGGGKEKHCPEKFTYIDAYADFRSVDTTAKHFSKNLNHPDSWEEMIDHANTYGKFDYCVCTHTLEDLSICMEYVSKQLPKIAKKGLISVPSKYREFLKFELDCEYRGFLHHRWIFDVKDDHILVYPKSSFIDSGVFDVLASKDDSKHELSIHWEEDVPLTIFNNGWMGPSAPEYREMFFKSITQ